MAFYLRNSLCSRVTAKSISDLVTDLLDEILLFDANDVLLVFRSAIFESFPSETNLLFANCSSLESSLIFSWDSVVLWLRI